MTDEEINLAIAEACGWKAHDHPDCMAKKEGWSMPERWIMRPDGTLAFRHNIPNYCSDLNAMHEVEKTLSEDQMWIMARNIELNEDRWYFHASARERAEAFLKTIGKWNHFPEAGKKVEEVQQ